MSASWVRIVVIAGAIGLVCLALFTIVVRSSVLFYRPFYWWLEPDLNAGDVAIGLRTSHPHPNVGDMVLYVPPMRRSDVLAGRVAGVPGDSIVIDGGQLYRNETAIPFFHGPLPLYQLQVAGAGVMLGNEYLDGGNWPAAARWDAANRIPDDCYLVLVNDPAGYDSHTFGLVPGSTDGPCASARFPQAHIISAVINVWRLGLSREAFLARREQMSQHSPSGDTSPK